MDLGNLWKGDMIPKEVVAYSLRTTILDCKY